MNRKWLEVLRIPIVVAGILMVGIGVSRNEPAVVLTKAIYICLECIGIG